MEYLLVRESFDEGTGATRDVHLGVFTSIDDLDRAKYDDLFDCLRHDFGYVPADAGDARDVVNAFAGWTDYYFGKGFTVYKDEVDGESLTSPLHLWRVDELH